MTAGWVRGRLPAEQINLNAAFQEAMDEIKTEWRTFRAAFGDRMEEGRMR